MKNTASHLGSLIGRVFLLSHSNAIQNWNGWKENQTSQNDYELLDSFISYEEGHLTSFNKPDGSVFYIYFSMSSRIELYSVKDGFIICDGLYFGNSWDYSKEMAFSQIGEIDYEINVVDELYYLFDAALSGNSIVGSSGLSPNNDSISIKLQTGNYTISKVETKLFAENQEILLKGIQVSL